MKKIEAIIRPGKLNDVLDELNRHQIFGITVTQVMGCGLQGGRTQYYRGNKYSINLLPKTKIETIVKDSWVDEIVQAIIKVARTGEIGDGKVFIYDVEDAYRIRTDQRGEAAIT
ncbi:MAG: P-II family nitrogen regulator [Clostridia bacterium]|nr:P-II family nitrogen regulator [Clostridia bacterium]